MPEGMETPVSVVLVEDDPALANALTHALRAWSFEVTPARSGEEALGLLDGADVLITDVRLRGGMDGLGLLQEAKRRQPEVEVIVITGHAAMDTAVQCVRAGAFDLLLKPFETVELISSVNRALERQRLHTTAAIFESSRQLFLLNEPGDVAKTLAPWAGRALCADLGAVLVPDGASGLELISAYHRAGDGLAGPLLELARRIGLETQARILDASAARADERLTGIPGLETLGSILLFPMRSAGRVTAVLALQRLPGGPIFRPRDLLRASVLGTQALVALESYQLSRRYAAMERLAAMGEMAAGVAHEINNPMAFVRSNLKFVEDCLLELLGTVALLNEGRPADALNAWDAAGGPGLFSEVQFAVEEAVEGADRISALVRDMRQVSRRDPVAPHHTLLVEAMDSALRLAGGEIKTCRVSVEIPPSLAVDADPGRLSQAFLNVLVNAAQSMEGLPDAELRVQARLEAPFVYVDVIDQGGGVPPELQSRIFEPFFTTKRPGKGTGLGLPISRQTLHAHGGDLTFVSRPGDGTTFTFRLPVLAD